MAKKIICEVECPACGDNVEFTEMGEKLCPHCEGMLAELTLNWEIIEENDNGTPNH